MKQKVKEARVGVELLQMHELEETSREIWTLYTPVTRALNNVLRAPFFFFFTKVALDVVET